MLDSTNPTSLLSLTPRVVWFRTGLESGPNLSKLDLEKASKEAKEAEKAKEAKRKGRFQIVENDDKAKATKPQVRANELSLLLVYPSCGFQARESSARAGHPAHFIMHPHVCCLQAKPESHFPTKDSQVLQATLPSVSCPSAWPG